MIVLTLDNKRPAQGIIRMLRDIYPKGSRVELLNMNDPKAPPEGTQGTVIDVDDIGTVHVRWDNGIVLGTVYGEDSIKNVPKSEEEQMREVKKYYQVKGVRR